MDLPEFQLELDENLDCSHDSVIAIKDGSFAWENEDEDEPATAPESQPRRRRKRANKNEKSANGNAVPEPETQMLQPVKELVDCLHSVQFEVGRGSLVGVCGSGRIEKCNEQCKNVKYE